MYVHWHSRIKRVIIELTPDEAKDLLIDLWTVGKKHSYLYTEIVRELNDGLRSKG